MKGCRNMKRILSALIVIYMLSASCFAHLSPAMEIIQKSLELKRCITHGESCYFSEKTIDEAFGVKAEKIVINSLPHTSKGSLKLSGSAVKQGQTIERRDFNRLAFYPTNGFTGSAGFSICCADSVLNCFIAVTDTVNYSPETKSDFANTQQGIAVFKTISAADPEADKMTFEIVSFPKHGSVEINDGDGVFVYRPVKNYLGKDSFSYVASDVNGNRSRVQTVEIKVSKPACSVYFDDMHNHWAHNAAVKMAATGLVDVAPVDGKRLFHPEENMSRGDFLALSLIMTGNEEKVAYVSKTSFEDDSNIPANIKSYAQYAYDNGIVSGYSNPDGTVNFESLNPVTRAEAAVILEKILSLSQKQNHALAFKDASDVPAWACDAVSTLSAHGIISGSPDGSVNAQNFLTRAEGAQIICNANEFLSRKLQN